MEIQQNDTINVNRAFESMLKNKKGIVKGKFDICHVSFEKKINYIAKIIHQQKYCKVVNYRILYWSSDCAMNTFIGKTPYKDSFLIYKSYKQTEKPGILFVLNVPINDEGFIDKILKYHLNYELARTPSLNMRVQIYIDNGDNTLLLDIYDDRGFNTYMHIK